MTDSPASRVVCLASEADGGLLLTVDVGLFGPTAERARAFLGSRLADEPLVLHGPSVAVGRAGRSLRPELGPSELLFAESEVTWRGSFRVDATPGPLEVDIVWSCGDVSESAVVEITGPPVDVPSGQYFTGDEPAAE